MCLEGLSFFKIAKKLTNEGVKTPAQYYNFKWKSNYNLKYGEWHSKTIRDILTNRMYIGDMVENRRSKVNYKVKKVIKNHPNNYIIVENTHKAIIDKVNIKKELEILLNDIKQINVNLDIIYIDKLNKKITEEQFERVKLKLENELNIKQKRYNELNNNINDTINEQTKNKMIIEYINKFLSMKEPSRELITNLIDKIEIFEDKTINIKVSFS